MKAITPRAILIAGWAAFLVFAYPGQMTQDSLDQLREARAGIYTDSHPPMMQLVWSIVDRIIPGAFGMLLLQSAALLVGAYLVLAHLVSPTRAAIGAACVIVFPPVMTVMAVVWKDSLMAGLLLLGIALLLAPRRRTRVIGLVVVGLAASLRYNGLAAALPPVVLLFDLQLRRARYPIAIAAWLAIAGLGLGANAALTDRKMYY